MSIRPPLYLAPLLSLFAAAGERAYPVGGCVRDALLGAEPNDWDVAVTTPPEVTAQLCEDAGYRVIPTGIKHGTVTVLLPCPDGTRVPVECTTCRTESGYTDGRHPDKVSFTGRIEDDLSRRDFTINAMALDVGEDASPTESLTVLDLFGGQADLAAGLIRCVGDPLTRFSEDALRMLRAVRFAVRLGFAIEPATLSAIRTLAPTLGRISRERIEAELQKILCTSAPARGIGLLEETGLLPSVLPGGISPFGMGDLDSLPPDYSLRLACLLWGLSDEALDENIAALRLPGAIRQAVRRLVAPCHLPTEATPTAARRWRAHFGELAAGAIQLRLAHASPAPQGEDEPTPSAILSGLLALVRRSEEDAEPVAIGDLAINGHDLLALGFAPGEGLRETLTALLSLVWEDPAHNTRAYLTEEALRLKGE